MKTYFQLLLSIKEATAAPVEVSVGKRSWEQLRQELQQLLGSGRKPTYADIGHIPVEKKHYSIYGIKKKLPVPFELWWTDDGSTINRKKSAGGGDEFLMHGIPGKTGLGGVLKTVGGDQSRYKGRIDHERKAMTVVFGGAYDYTSILRMRALEKGIPNIIRKMKQLYPNYALHYWDTDGKVQSL